MSNTATKMKQVSKQDVEKGWGVPARVLPRPYAHCSVLSAATLLSLSWTRLVTQLLVAVVIKHDLGPAKPHLRPLVRNILLWFTRLL